MGDTKDKDCWILFTDLDDTLLNSKKEISAENARAVELALSRGHKVVVSTGRPLAGATAQIERLGLNREGCYAITYNGGLIYDCYARKTVFAKTLPLSYVQHIFEQADTYGLYCQTYDSTHVIAREETPELVQYIKRIQVPSRLDAGCPQSLTEEPVKVLVIGDESREKSEAYRLSMQEWAAGKVDIFYSNQTYMEHVAQGISKGNALRQLCEILKVPVEHTVAAGDAENDISMLLAAGVGAAMANANEIVKASADYVTQKDCDHDGVSEIIHKFIL